MYDLFYRNTRLLMLAVTLIVVAGLSSFYVLPRLEDPQLTDRNAIINTYFPGATAERVESLVTEKLEDELQEIEEIKELRSTSRAGVSTIVIELKANVTETGTVWSRIRDKLDDARPELPAAAMKPDFDVIEPRAYAMIVSLGWTQDENPNYAILRRRAELLEDRLRAVAGTEDIETYGDPDEEVAVEVRQADLVSLGLTVADIAAQLAASDAKIAAGQLRSSDGNFLLEVDTELDSIDRIAAMPIQYGTNGNFVRLADIAEVRKGIVNPPRSLAVINGHQAVALGVHVLPDYRIDRWTDAATVVVDDFADELPRGIELTTVFQQNKYVEARLFGLLGNLLLGGVAVIGVIWIMMGWRSAVVVATALPLSGLMVLSGMRLLDIPMHQMSITGLIIALGLLIDNAIVMVDEVREKLRDGATPSGAVSASVRHLGVPLLGSTLTTALAFAPIALMPGPAGEFVGSIAVSVILAVFSSLLLAMTVTPALAALIGGISTDGQRRWWRDGVRFERLTSVYRRLLNFMFRRPALGIGLGLILPIIGFATATTLPEQFFPPADRDQFQIQWELPPRSSINETLSVIREAREMMLQEYPELTSVDWFIGESAPTFYYNLVRNREGTPHYAQAIVQIDQVEGYRDLIHRLQADLDSRYPAARVIVRQLEQGPPFDAPVELRLYGPDINGLRDQGNQIRGVLAATPNVIHTRAEMSEPLPKLSVRIDEEQARLAGLDHASIARQLDASLEGAVGGSVLETTEELPVRVRLSDEDRADFDRIASLELLPTAGGVNRRHVPLSALSTIELMPEDTSISHFNGQRMNEIKAYVPAGVLPATVQAAFENQLAASGIELPAGYSYEFGGESEKRNESIGNLMSSVPILIVLMVATLVLSFHSFRIAALIAMVAVLSVGLGLGALWQFGFPFGFMAIVGTMGLIGVAINDTIVVIAALRADERARSGDPTAVGEVVVRSTRHILSTTLTTTAGFTPLVLAGGGFWPPLAVAIAGGVSGATILALIFVPASYVLVMCRGCKPAKSEQEQTNAADLPRPAENHRQPALPVLA